MVNQVQMASTAVYIQISWTDHRTHAHQWEKLQYACTVVGHVAEYRYSSGMGCGTHAY